MSLKSIFKDIRQGLVNFDSVSETFSKLKNDEDRFSLAYGLCHDYYSRLKLESGRKCNDNSAAVRKLGNELFKKRSYWEALKHYNKSIAYASNESPELCLAYGNRASCLIRLNYFREALQDVEIALHVCISHEFKEKLLARKNQCLFNINKNHSESKCTVFSNGVLPSLGRNKSLFLDSASEVVEISHDDYWERKLIVNDNVHVGEILMVEKPFSSLVLPQYFYTHCSKCFKRSLNLIPCNNCTTTMFCSKACQDSANHSTECLYLEILCKLNAERRELLSLKVLTDATNEGRNLETLHSDLKSSDGDTCRKCYRSDDFMNIYNLVTNTDKRNSADLFYRSIISAILVLTLEKYTNFFNSVSEEKRSVFQIFCGGLILRFMQSLPCNAHEVSEYYCSNLIEIGAGAYAAHSLINHSCDPNVVRYSCGNKIVLRAIKPIKKGEQILDNYGYHYATHSLEERQTALSEQYYFKCQCEACVGMWPMFSELIDRPLKTVTLIDSVLYNKLTKQFEVDLKEVMEKHYSDKVVERNMAYLEYLHNVVELPWVNYNKCQELIKHCLNFHYNFFEL